MILPFGLEVFGAIWLAFSLLVAGIVRGYAGFGFSGLVVAAGALVTSPLLLVPVVIAIEVALSVQMIRSIGPQADWRRVWLLGAGVILGIPFGLWALTTLPEDGARIAISGFILLMCFILLAGFKIAEQRGAAVNIAIGGLAGMANAAGMGGMPVAAYFTAQSLRPAVFRATLVAFFPILDLVSLPLYWAYGMIRWDSLWAIFYALPFALLGNALGTWAFNRRDPRDFRLLVICLLMGLAVMGLVKSFLNII